MNEIVLHHYAGSPFSEKVRLVLGMKRLAWRSVDVPVILPKPDVVALTGGYRRTPFMQIGADVYCDSALMCRVIDRIAPEPSLYPGASRGLAEIVAQWADSALFWTAVPFTMQPAAAPFLLADASPESLRAFAADRAAMNPAMRRAPLADAAAMASSKRAGRSRISIVVDIEAPQRLHHIPNFDRQQSAGGICLASPNAQLFKLAPP